MDKKIEIAKTFNAPVEMVWKLWTEPELVKRWWGPAHFTCPVAKIDCTPGGVSLVSMKAPAQMGGQEFFSLWEYTRVLPLQEIEFIQNLSDELGNKMKPVDLGMPPDFPTDIRTVVTFKKISDDVTEMTVTEYAEFGSMSHFAKLGLEQSMEKMGAVFS